MQGEMQGMRCRVRCRVSDAGCVGAEIPAQLLPSLVRSLCSAPGQGSLALIALHSSPHWCSPHLGSQQLAVPRFIPSRSLACEEVPTATLILEHRSFLWLWSPDTAPLLAPRSPTAARSSLHPSRGTEVLSSNADPARWAHSPLRMNLLSIATLESNLQRSQLGLRVTCSTRGAAAELRIELGRLPKASRPLPTLQLH